MAEQDRWHFCKKCGVMHFAPSKGPCVAGDEHEAQGFNFTLPHGIAEAPFTQRDWRFCRKCHGLFFGGNPGRCIKGGGHDGKDSFDFVLTHSVPEAPGKQGKWFFCRNCSLMNFGPFNGRCIAEKLPGSAIRGHDDVGSFEFTLPHTPEFIK
jgi:hypothetical protein